MELSPLYTEDKLVFFRHQNYETFIIIYKRSHKDVLYKCLCIQKELTLCEIRKNYRNYENFKYKKMLIFINYEL